MKYTIDEFGFLSGSVIDESPAGVTSAEPPRHTESLRPAWRNSAWVLEPDYRGRLWFNQAELKYEVSNTPEGLPAPWVLVAPGEVGNSDPHGPDDVFDYVAKVWVPNLTARVSAASTKRNQLLAASDWTQLPDVPPATKEAWAPYRQALRDITTQPGYPTEIAWPTPPN